MKPSLAPVNRTVVMFVTTVLDIIKMTVIRSCFGFSVLHFKIVEKRMCKTRLRSGLIYSVHRDLLLYLFHSLASSDHTVPEKSDEIS